MPERRIEISGVGSLTSNRSAHSGAEGDFTVFKDLYVDKASRIRKRPGTGPFRGFSTGSKITRLHEYTYTNPTTGAVTRYLIRGLLNGTLEFFAGTGVAWTPLSVTVITPSTSSLWAFANVDNECFAVNGQDAMLAISQTTVRKVGADGPTSGYGYSLGGVASSGTVTVTKGSKTVTHSATGFTTGGAWDDKIIEIDGTRYTIESVSSTSVLLLTEAFKSDLDGSGKSWLAFTGVQDWDLPPRYAFAYYNPTTGHVSNIRANAVTQSNILEITEHDVVGRTVTVSSIPYGTDQYANGYTEIKVFRTPRNGNILVALDYTLPNSATPGSTSHIETSTTAPDTFLTRFEAPLTSNRIPQTGLQDLVYHGGRLWAVKNNRLYYSLTSAETAFGNSEECWPERQNMTIPQAKGLTLIGGGGADEVMIIRTEDGDFSVEGWDVRSFRDYRLPTRSTGSFRLSASSESGTFQVFYGDKRVLEYPSGRDLGLPIQDLLSQIPSTYASLTAVQRFTGGQWNILLVSCAKQSGSTRPDVTYVYDYDLEKWYQWEWGFDCFTTAHDLTTGEIRLWGGTWISPNGYAFEMLRSDQWQDNGTSFAPTLTTTVLRPFGEYDARLKAIQIWVNDEDVSWTGELLINEQAAGSGLAIDFIKAPHQRQNAQGRLMEWKPPVGVVSQANAFQLKLDFPTTSADLYVEKIVLFFEQVTVEPSRGHTQ